MCVVCEHVCKHMHGYVRSHACSQVHRNVHAPVRTRFFIRCARPPLPVYTPPPISSLSPHPSAYPSPYLSPVSVPVSIPVHTDLRTHLSMRLGTCFQNVQALPVHPHQPAGTSASRCTSSAKPSSTTPSSTHVPRQQRKEKLVMIRFTASKQPNPPSGR